MTRTLGVWMHHRAHYLRGRAALAGLWWDGLPARLQYDIADAVLTDAVIAGAAYGVSLDKVLDALDDNRREAHPETFGTSRAAAASARAAESIFGPTAPEP